MAWVKKMSLEVYKEFLTTLFSVGLGKAELLFNCKKLSELKLRKDYDAFPCFIF